MSSEPYDINYSQDDFFHNRKRINRTYVKNIIRKAGLLENSTVLDVGCGQGYFSHLFNRCGMDVLGIDLSETGIRYAQEHYGKDRLSFVVGDALEIPVSMKFDCVFTRSLSLYNTDRLEQIRSTTDKLMAHLKENGLFILTYNAIFSRKKQVESWRHHTLKDMRRYFSPYQNKAIYFSSKVDCLVFGRRAFNPVFSQINICASRCFKLGGEIVCFIRKTA
jgi:2-polyprenyl-3-methyl-5-hydroxy-6-metoxy-1,4-benzoquinol methylase